MKWASLCLVTAMVTSCATAPVFANSEFTDPPMDAQLDCLAKNIYFEARDQEPVGQLAVAFVTMNRVESDRYPNTICDVVKHGYDPLKINCQFSWYCDGKSDFPMEVAPWLDAKMIAQWFMGQREYLEDPTDGATHYHTTSVGPWWIESDKMTYLTQIGDHKFYYEGR